MHCVYRSGFVFLVVVTNTVAGLRGEFVLVIAV